MDNELLSPADYQTAIIIQDACNLSGIVHTFSQVMHKICNEANKNGYGTDWKNRHPISVLFASKIASLTGCSEISQGFEQAYNACCAAAKGEIPHVQS